MTTNMKESHNNTHNDKFSSIEKEKDGIQETRKTIMARRFGDDDDGSSSWRDILSHNVYHVFCKNSNTDNEKYNLSDGSSSSSSSQSLLSLDMSPLYLSDATMLSPYYSDKSWSTLARHAMIVKKMKH